MIVDALDLPAIPATDRDALLAICSAQLADDRLAPWAVEQRWGPEALARLRGSGLVRRRSDAELEGSWWGWKAAYPDRLASVLELLLQMQADVRDGRPPAELSSEMVSLLGVMPPVGGVAVAGGRATVDASKLAAYDFSDLLAAKLTPPSHALPALYAYGVRRVCGVYPSTHASIRGADLRGATFVDSSFSGLDLSSVRFDGCRFERCRFEAAALQDASLRSAELRRCVLRNSDLRGADLDGARLLDRTHVDLDAVATQASWTVLHFDDGPLYRTGPELIRIEERALGWAVMLRGEELGTLDLKWMPVLAGLVRQRGRPVHVLDAERWLVCPDAVIPDGPPTSGELGDLVAAAGIDGVTRPWLAKLNETERWRLAAIARRLGRPNGQHDPTLGRDQEGLREFVAEHVAKPKVSLPQGTGPLKNAAARVSAGLQEIISRCRADAPELGRILELGIERQEFCRFTGDLDSKKVDDLATASLGSLGR